MPAGGAIQGKSKMITMTDVERHAFPELPAVANEEPAEGHSILSEWLTFS